MRRPESGSPAPARRLCERIPASGRARQSDRMFQLGWSWNTNERSRHRTQSHIRITARSQMITAETLQLREKGGNQAPLALFSDI